MTTNIETRWAIEYPADSLFTPEQRAQINAIVDDPLVQSRQTRDEVKQAVLKLTGIPFLTPSYIIRDLSL